MQYLLILIKVLPFIMQLMQVAEKYFTAPGSGSAKKEAVTAATEVLVTGMTDMSTGGQADTWARIGPFISTIIDSAAEMAFPHTPPPPDAG